MVTDPVRIHNIDVNPFVKLRHLQIFDLYTYIDLGFLTLCVYIISFKGLS